MISKTTKELEMMEFVVGSQHCALVSGIEPYKIHILGIVDCEQIVFKWYGRHKQWWHYQIERRDILEIKISRAKQCT